MAHGEAIAIGMIAEARIANRTGLFPPGETARLTALLTRLGLPTSIPASIGPEEILAVAHRDKKARLGKIAYALPVRIGAMANIAGDYGIAVEDDLAAGVLQEMRDLRQKETARLLPIESRV